MAIKFAKDILKELRERKEETEGFVVPMMDTFPFEKYLHEKVDTNKRVLDNFQRKYAERQKAKEIENKE